MKNNRLNETTIGTAKVIVDILPKGKCIPNTKITPTSITIHNTGNIGASAKNNHNYQKNCNKSGERIASWHFTCGWDEIYQAQSTNYKCYHAGCSTGNATSIGIEICMYNDKEKQRQAYLNAIELVKILMDYHGFSINQVKQHYNWTKKNCPEWLRSGHFGFTWNWFIEQCKGKVTEKPNEFKPYLARCTTNELNCRKGAGVNYEVERQIDKGVVITIVEEKMNGSTKWLKSLSGYWVSAKYMQFIRYI